MMDIEEVLKQSLVVILHMEEVKRKVVKQLEIDIKDYNLEPLELEKKKTQIKYLQMDLKNYKKLKESLYDYIQNPTKIYFPDGINYG